MRHEQLDVRKASYPCLADKRVIITGGGSGIGEAIVEAFALQGAKVGFVDVAEEPSLILVERLEGIACPVLFRHKDLRDNSSLQHCLEGLIDELGGCDVLVNNAASDDRHSVEEVTPDYWDERLAVNLKHQFFAAQQVIGPMRSVGGGAIINLGSISWHLGLTDLVIYQTAKAAVEGLTRGLARELGKDNIRVNTIIPGNVQTPRQARWYTPEGEAEIVAAQCLKERIQPSDIADMALFLASDGARMCTGHNYWVDAGWR